MTKCRAGQLSDEPGGAGGAEQLLDKVYLREGSVLQPRFPAPLGLRGITVMRHMAVCLGLIATATGGETMAAHSAYVIWYRRGKGGDGEPFLMSDGVGVGYGARPLPARRSGLIA